VSDIMRILRLVCVLCALCCVVDCNPVKRDAVIREPQEPLCRNNGQMLNKLKGYKMNVQGFDAGSQMSSSFESIGTKLDITGFNRKEKNNSVYFKNTVVTGDQVTRNKKRKLSSGGDVKVKACKPSISGWKRRFDAFPFFTPDIQCYRTQQVPDTKAFKIECVPTYERRHILKLKGGCNSSGSPDEEVWEHSWEEVISGCDTVFIF